MNSFYDDFRLYKDSAKRVGWYDKLDQDLKFAFVSEMVSAHESILDLGSGLGDLSRFLSERGHIGSYLGVEKDKILLDASRALYPDLHFFHQDFTEAPYHPADIAICVGGLLSGESVSLEKVLAFLNTYPKFILIGISEKSTSSLRFEPNFVGIPAERSVKLNENEAAILYNCEPKLTPIQRLEGLISKGSYPDESVARALYGLGEKKQALKLLQNCQSELAKAMMSAWQ